MTRRFLTTCACIGILTSGILRADDSPPKPPDYESITTVDEAGNTRLTPGKVNRDVIDQILSWGSNERHGWRVGALLINDLDPGGPVPPGETIAVQYFLQNVTNETQTIRVQKIEETYPALGAGGRLNLNTMHLGAESVEFTAAPGEAVSPDGYAILLDTQGLPDGDYTVYTVSAFSIPAANGRGGGSPWRVGSVTMTLGEGGAFATEPTTDDDGIVWGAEVAGLRVGMRLPNGEKAWPAGSLLEGELFAKNVSDEAISFDWNQPAPIDQNQVVNTADGEYVQLRRVFFTGIRVQNPQSFTVEPGQQVRLGTAQLQLTAEAAEIGAADPAQLVATSGKFTWQVHVDLPRKDVPQLTFIVGSGPVPFEIVTGDRSQ